MLGYITEQSQNRNQLFWLGPRIQGGEVFSHPFYRWNQIPISTVSLPSNRLHTRWMAPDNRSTQGAEIRQEELVVAKVRLLADLLTMAPQGLHAQSHSSKMLMPCCLVLTLPPCTLPSCYKVGYEESLFSTEMAGQESRIPFYR